MAVIVSYWRKNELVNVSGQGWAKSLSCVLAAQSKVEDRSLASAVRPSVSSYFRRPVRR